jgi:Predicted transcriptional regulator
MKVSEDNSIKLITSKQLEEFAVFIIERYKESQIEEEGLCEPKLLSTDEVCKLLDISRSTLWNWNKRGTLKPKKIGRKNVYYKKEIYDYVSNL